MNASLAAIVLAAGFGRRFGEAPAGTGKLHALLEGEPVLRHSLKALAGLPLSEILVVVAPEDARAVALARDAGALPVPNPARAGGLGTSLACGARALSGDADGVMVLLGDMPRIAPATLRALLARWMTLERDDVLAPGFGGRRGHPVIFGAGYLPALRGLEGDQGAREILAASRGKMLIEDVEDAGVLLDIDTPADLAAATGSGSRP